MADQNVPRFVSRKYEAPTILRVQVEAQQELLQTTGCGFGDGSVPGIKDCTGIGNGPYNV